MKKILSTLIILSLCTAATFSQERTGDDLRSNLGLYSGDLMNFYNEVAQNKLLETDDISSIEGSPYLYDEFTKGDIVTTDSILYSGIMLRYNIYNNVIEFKKNDVALELNEKFPLLYALVNNAIFVKIENQEGYFLRLSSGKLNLLEKKRIKFAQSKPASGYRATTKAAFKKLDSQYFIYKNSDTPMVEIKKKTDFLPLVSDKKEEIEDYMKKENIKITKGEDLAALVDYYNSL